MTLKFLQYYLFAYYEVILLSTDNFAKHFEKLKIMYGKKYKWWVSSKIVSIVVLVCSDQLSSKTLFSKVITAERYVIIIGCF